MKTALVLALCAAAAIPAIAIAEAPAAKPPFARFDPDTNHDGYLSRAEAQAMADAQFKRLDVNGDGKLMPGEHPERHWRGPPPGAQAGDGAPPAPPEAGAPPLPGPQAGPPPDRGRWGPPGSDHGPMGPRMGRFGGPRMGGFGPMGLGPDVFAEYNSNHDGALSLTEFRAHAMRTFDARDGNRDGKIKLPERRAHGQGPGMGPAWGAPPPKG